MLTCLSLALIIPILGCSNFKEGQQSTYFGPRLIITVGQNSAKWYPEDKDNQYTNVPQMVIEAITPVVCSNTSDGEFSGSHCALSQNVLLPERILFRYGKWLSEKEEYRQFPPIPEEEYANLPLLVDNYESRAAFEKAKDDFYEKLFSIPKYKAVREAKIASKEAINWHTYTFYPRKAMKKYENLSPYNRIRSSVVEYDIDFNPNFTVTTEEYLRYLDPVEIK